MISKYYDTLDNVNNYYYIIIFQPKIKMEMRHLKVLKQNLLEQCLR